MIGSKFILGILVGFFVIPAVLADPQGTFETAKNVVTKIVEVAGFLGGAM